MIDTCPCCSQSVQAPSLSEVIEAYGLSGHDAHVLGAVWEGRGMPVMTERIFDAMYADDPDGGPSPTRMYSEFRKTLGRLNERLKAVGVSVQSVGWRQGYRLELGGN